MVRPSNFYRFTLPPNCILHVIVTVPLRSFISSPDPLRSSPFIPRKDPSPPCTGGKIRPEGDETTAYEKEESYKREGLSVPGGFSRDT